MGSLSATMPTVSTRTFTIPFAILGVWAFLALIASYSHGKSMNAALVAEAEAPVDESPGLAAAPLAARTETIAGATQEAPVDEVKVAGSCPACNAAELRKRLLAAEARIVELERELSTCQGAQAAALSPSVTRWVGELTAIGGTPPESATLLTMARILEPYPVALTLDEGTWIAERAKLWDWKSWGSTVDEVLVRHLGPERIAREVPPAKLAELRDSWPEYFGG